MSSTLQSHLTVQMVTRNPLSRWVAAKGDEVIALIAEAWYDLFIPTFSIKVRAMSQAMTS